ncbi:MAG TPA: FtsQ-type POTRA domain-containing protein [Ornithinibacter sp.]|jgi:cell division protein FtsQ|nr:FtsQ-type POTRA domain-containing protein [Ornithinibacter sp.]
MSVRTTRTNHSTASRQGVPSANRFRERALSNRRRPWRRALRLLTALAAAGVLVWAVGWSTVLGVEEVRVSGVSGEEADAVTALVAVPEGTPLARVDTDAVAARVRGRVSVAEASVRRTWPRALTVDVVPRTAAIVVRNPQGRLEVVDASGVAFGTVAAAPPGVPVVTATGSAGTSREALLAALSVVQALPDELSRDVSAVTVTSANLVRFTLGTRTVVWGGGEDAARKVAILTVLLKTKASVVDVSAPETPVTR